VLWNLPEDTQREIYELRSLSLRDLVAKLAADYGVQTSIASLSPWLRAYHLERCSETRASAVAFADEVEAEAAKVDQAVATQLGLMAFDAAMTKDVSALKQCYSMLLQRQTIANERERMAEAQKTSREKAVDALLAEAKGNPQAVALLNQLVSLLSPSVSSVPSVAAPGATT
jgi:hypothetical protein